VKRSVSLTARQQAEASSGNPELMTVQLAAPFIDQKTPLKLAKKRFVPLTARSESEKSMGLGNPKQAGIQLAPLFPDQKTRPPC
jgi:hypothetical protein